MTTAETVLSLARRIVASVSLLSLGACCREVDRFDGSFAVAGGMIGVRFTEAGAVDDASCIESCQWVAGRRCGTVEVRSCSATTVDGGPGLFCNGTNFDCPPPPFSGTCGRRTDGVDEVSATRARDTLGVLVALEAEAIAAFERLAKELVALDAPASLVRAARASAEDERRHVAMVSALDGRAVIDEPDSNELSLRSAFDVAKENAVEGCVRELFGAIVAQWQSEHSADERVRACYAEIARDEAQHARLAGQLDEWLAARLSADERAKITAAKRDAINKLRAEQRASKGDAWLGMPDATVAMALVDGLAREMVAVG